MDFSLKMSGNGEIHVLANGEDTSVRLQYDEANVVLMPDNQLYLIETPHTTLNSEFRMHLLSNPTTLEFDEEPMRRNFPLLDWSTFGDEQLRGAATSIANRAALKV